MTVVGPLYMREQHFSGNSSPSGLYPGATVSEAVPFLFLCKTIILDPKQVPDLLVGLHIDPPDMISLMFKPRLRKRTPVLEELQHNVT